MFIVGIDIGASATKAVIIDPAKKIIASHIHKTGIDLTEASQTAYHELLHTSRLKPSDISLIAATGFGRNNVTYADRTITEITCHAVGAYHYFPRAITVIDIGGQDNKIIKVDEKGLVTNFKMNRKCAAGTGAFIEEIAFKIDVTVSELNEIARESTKDVEIGSFCTVFTATEILAKIRAGEKKEDIIRGVFLAVAKRVIEMDTLEGEIVLTGGVVAYNDIMISIFSTMLNKPVLVPPEPQLTGALGAALIGLKNLVDK
ncbi:MAG: ATPase [Planctomycetes bacterium]|nr:ATPase [Planctomycetota bacterium]